jgi:hypothetical protein
MPDLNFAIAHAEPVPFAATPTMTFTLAIENSPREEPIHTVLLTAQIRIETARRRYTPAEQDRLLELFGEPQRWGETLRPMHWTQANASIPAFTGAATFDLHVPCTYDFNVAATKYFDALPEGHIPLLFLFSGTVFYAGARGALQAARISWSKEARFRLPASVWRDLMKLYYPNSAWLNVRREVFDRLNQYRLKHGFASCEEALERLLPAFEPRAASDRQTAADPQQEVTAP